MFSKEPRCNYQNNQLMEVICQLRFPEILAISAKAPVDFQEAIRGEFPQYAVRQESPAPRITGTPGNLTLQNQPTTPNHSFISAESDLQVYFSVLPCLLQLGGFRGQAGPAIGCLHSDLQARLL